MNGVWHPRVLSFLASLWLAGTAFGLDHPAISWRTAQQQVDAEIPGWPLERVLQSLSATTGWQVHLDPAARQEPIATRFRELQPTEALRRLVGGLSFALLPQTNGPAKLFVFRGSLQDATQLVEPLPPETASAPSSELADELIVRLKPGAKTSIDALAEKLKAKIVGRLEGQNAYRLRFENEDGARAAREELAALDDVAAVESNYAIASPSRLDPLTFSSAPGLSLRARTSPNQAYTVVALVDTAVASDQSALKAFLLPTISVVESAAPTTSELTHGTAMAQTLLQSLSQTQRDPAGTTVRILPVDVYGQSPETSTFDVVRGLLAAAQQGPAVINLSLGSDGDSPLLRDTIASLSKQGVLVVAAAGNSPQTTLVYPAAYPDVLAVTAGDRSGQIAPYANRGAFIDLVAPGTSILQHGQQTFLGTGTSYSAAFITGAAAGLLSSPGERTASDVETTLRQRYGVQSGGP